MGRQIAHLYQDNDDVVLTNLDGEQIRVPGMILGADLLRAVVYIGNPALAVGDSSQSE